MSGFAIIEGRSLKEKYMVMMKKKPIIVLVVVLVLIVGASLLWKNNYQTGTTNEDILSDEETGDEQTTGTPANETFSDNSWVLEKVTLNNRPVDMNVNVEQVLNITFKKSDKSFNGFGGCNSFSGNYSAFAPNRFSFGDVISTKKYCSGASSLEDEVLNAMGRVHTFEVNGEKLVLKSNDGETVIEYKKAI